MNMTCCDDEDQERASGCLFFKVIGESNIAQG